MKQVAFLLTLAVVLAACSPAQSEQAGPAAQTTPQATATARSTSAATTQDAAPTTVSDLPAFDRGVSAIGEVTANQDADLFFRAAGTVGEVYVDEGAPIAAGDLLAILDTRPFDQSIQDAQASLADALARQAALTEPPQAYDVTAAQANIVQAEAALAELQAGAKAQDIATTRSTLEQAQINLQTQRNMLSTNKTNAELQIDQLANQIRDVQDQYSQIYWDNRELEDDLRNEELPQENKNQEEAALRAVETAEQQLAQAYVALEEAQQAEVTGIQNAEQQVIQAQEALDKLLLPPDVDDLAAAESAVVQARTSLERLYPNPTASERDQAAAAVARAQTQLETAQLNRSYAELYAPFAGVVADVTIDPGDPVSSSGQPVIELVDISTLYVEVDVNDIDIVKVALNQPASIFVEALPEAVFTGTVRYIAPSATINGNVRTYEVHVALDAAAQLQDGMSVRVVLEPGAAQ